MRPGSAGAWVKRAGGAVGEEGEGGGAPPAERKTNTCTRRIRNKERLVILGRSYVIRLDTREARTLKLGPKVHIANVRLPAAVVGGVKLRTISRTARMGRCKLDPGLKARLVSKARRLMRETCFQLEFWFLSLPPLQRTRVWRANTAFPPIALQL